MRAADTVCPFCATPMRVVSRWSLGAIAIVGASLALSGCDLPIATAHADYDDDDAVRQTPQYGAPDYDPGPPPVPPPSTTNAIDAGPPPPRHPRHGY